MEFENVNLFPITTGVNESNHLTLGGCDAVELTSTFGTPLYVFDENTIRYMCRQFVGEFTKRYPNTRVVYASKAFTNPIIAKLIKEEGLGLDVVSGGELAVAKVVDFPSESIYFHGNNKSADELEMALDYGVGCIVVDSFHELEMLQGLSLKKNVVQNVMLRLSPDVDPHTHALTTTGVLDSKFGFAMETGHAEQAALQVLQAPNLKLVGLHFHLGSPIFELEPYTIAIDAALQFAAKFKHQGLELLEFSPGGGFAIGYVKTQLPPSVDSYAEVMTSAVKSRCAQLGFDRPKMIIEPGRAIVGRAGVALYTVGAIKDIPGVRKYVSLDGGMGDNIRPALYEANYEAVVASGIANHHQEKVTLAGKFCESGDVLIKDVMLPTMKPGDVVAIPASGAYAPSMASNYNLNPRPAIVMVKDGVPTLMRRRETYQDMMLCDIY